ncbi:LCP family protein [Ornithinimicrobium avium]|uniref:LytR family transcriptional regulator n=1 Tax=Ornithinimicrobium avium TaxID=2283195 RepID=A0A345NMN8_9MICO|nr:LCP family protein [Ornithinimicrobium avium]AXH96296.1 LytR family transcriptional regulator [Ornithinimicrobium avium]
MNARRDRTGSHAVFGSRAEWVDHREGRGRTLGRALWLTALSALVPGAGLIGTRRRRLGLLIVSLLVLGTVALALVVRHNGLTATALETAADSRLLRTVLWCLLAGTLVWVAAIALTALTSRPRRSTGGQRAVLAVFTAVLCLAVSAPAALAVRYVDSHLAAMDKVFARPPSSPDGVEPTSALGPPDDPWADLPRVNVLLLGSDAAEAREGTRTDTMIVASIDTHTGDSVLFSVPRNLQKVPFPRDSPLHQLFPNGYDCGNQCLMNAVWTLADLTAEEHPDWFAGDPDPGLTATREVLETVLGLPIQHTVIVNLDGFADLVDAIGGVLVTVKDPIPINGRTFTNAQGNIQLDTSSKVEWLQPGTQRLTGKQALGYARSRVTTDDYDRMRRQRCIVAAVVHQVEPMTLLQRYPQIIGAVGDNVVTDIPRQDLPTWAELTLLVQGATMKSLPFTESNTDTVDPNFSDIRARVWEAIHPAPEAPATPGDSGSSTATASPTDGDRQTTTAPGPQDPGTTTPPDKLEDVGAVCD